MAIKMADHLIINPYIFNFLSSRVAVMIIKKATSLVTMENLEFNEELLDLGLEDLT